MVRTALLVVIMIMLVLCINFCASRMQESYSLKYKAFSAL